MFYYYDSSILLLLPAMIFAIYAQSKVSSTYKKYSNLQNRRGISAHEVARKILDRHGLYNIKIERVGGNLTDHYDPRTKIVRLSDGVYSSTSIAALGIAAHEVGHAIQHQNQYVPIKLRNMVLPVANIGSFAAFPLAIVGLILSLPPLVNFGIILFSAVVLFQIITLPVELNASRRAVTILENENVLYEEELKPAKKVLNAAAMTYVAAAAVSVANLLRLLALSRRK